MKRYARLSCLGRANMKVYGWASNDILKLTALIRSAVTVNPAPANATYLFELKISNLIMQNIHIKGLLNIPIPFELVPPYQSSD